jgi:drug/metabolite transporter (DMT)-like permease
MNASPTTERPPFFVHGALLAVSLLFGANYVVAKWVFREISPTALVVIRAWATAAILGLALVLRPRRDAPAIERRELGELFVYSILGVSLNQWCFLEGLSRSSATNASIMLVCIPVLTLAFAIMLKRERATLRGIAGIATGLAGALVLILPRGGIAMSGSAIVGNLFLFAGSASYSLYLVVSKPILRRHDPLVVVTWVFLLAGLTMLPFGFRELTTLASKGLSPEGWGALTFVVIGATVLPYLLNSWALARVQSSIVAVYILVQPMVAGAMGRMFLGERLGPNAAIAAVLIVAGVGMTVASQRVQPPRSFVADSAG